MGDGAGTLGKLAKATMLSRTLVLKVSGWKPVERLIRSRPFRPFVRRFIPGETVEEAIGEAERLAGQGYFVTLDYLGENTKSEAEARGAAETYARMIEAIAASPCSTPRKPKIRETVPAGGPAAEYDPGNIETTNISIKLTQCGLDLGKSVAEENYGAVVELAKAHESFVRVDMESSAYTQRTLEVVETVYSRHRNTGTVLQSYLHRTNEDVEWAIRLGMRIRLVKGAYLEPPETAIQSMGEIREAFLSQAKRLLSEGRYPAFATHDEKLVREVLTHAASEGIPNERYEFQMLYGIRRDLQEKLLREGYNVRIYVPFGESWYPYFSRRLAERPANLWFLLKSLFKR
jgi:proline dehydrogenase